MAGNMFATGSGLITGPAANIGGSADYHIDMNFGPLVDAGRIDDIIAIMDGVAQKAAESDSRVEFSNARVNNKVWDPNADPAVKKKLAEAVMDAHGDHSTNKAMDFYIVKEGETRGGASVEGVEMPMVLQEGWRVVYAQGGNYGNHAIVYDENNEMVYKMGHGDDRQPVPKDFVATGDYANQQSVTNIANPKTPEATPDMAQQWVKSINQARISEEIDENGAESAYNKFGASMPKIFQGMEGMLMPLLFMMVMMLAGAEQQPGEKDFTEYNKEERVEALREVDKKRGKSSPAQEGKDESPDPEHNTSENKQKKSPDSTIPSEVVVEMGKENISKTDFSFGSDIKIPAGVELPEANFSYGDVSEQDTVTPLNVAGSPPTEALERG